MPTIKQSAAWWCFVPAVMTPQAFVKAVAEIGYDAVELVPQKHWSLARDHGLNIAAIGGHGPLEDGLNKRENRDRILREIEHNLKLAQEWNIPNLIVFSGNRDGLDDETGAEATADTLREAANMAQSAGVMLVLELLNSKVDHPDYQCDRTLWGVKVCQMVDSPAVKLLYDIYHMQIMEGDLIRTIQDYHSYFGHYHTAGNPGRNDLDEAQEIYYPPVFRAIAATGYDRYIGHEFTPKGDPAAALRTAYELTTASIG